MNFSDLVLSTICMRNDVGVNTAKSYNYFTHLISACQVMEVLALNNNTYPTVVRATSQNACTFGILECC